MNRGIPKLRSSPSYVVVLKISAAFPPSDMSWRTSANDSIFSCHLHSTLLILLRFVDGTIGAKRDLCWTAVSLKMSQKLPTRHRQSSSIGNCAERSTQLHEPIEKSDSHSAGQSGSPVPLLLWPSVKLVGVDDWYSTLRSHLIYQAMTVKD